jgi:aryl-alcohol dehydrogenase-like predicted oxidoreductase
MFLQGKILREEDMEYRRLGRSGLKVSALVLGTMNFGEVTDTETSLRIIDSAMEAGINLIDCANAYAGGKSEEILGRALRRDGKRNRVLITSKVYLPVGPGLNDRGNSRHHILNACRDSLRRLKTDYIDIYFLHRTDWEIPQDETLSALDDLVRQGMVRYVGCSTHPAWRTVEAMHLAERYGYPRFICEEPPYNLLDRRIENEIIPMCQAYDLGILAWSPLAQGVLAGRYKDSEKFPTGSRGTVKNIYAERITPEGIAVARKMASLGEHKNCSLSRLSVAWVLHQPGITAVILGPRTHGHLEDLLPAVDVDLDESDLLFCDRLVPPGGAVSNHLNTSGWMKP